LTKCFGRRLFVWAFALLAAGVPVRAGRLIILETADLHGHVTARDELADRDLGEGLARVATAVEAIRSEARCRAPAGPLTAPADAGCGVLLLDAGDMIEGSPMETLHASSGRRDDPMIRAMNALGYSAACVGNHEFDYGLEVLSRARDDARFPFLSANVVGADGKPRWTPYVVRAYGNFRVGILGLTTRGVPDWERPSAIAGLSFLDTVQTARRYVPILRGKEHCDLVVVLTHQGFERDPRSGADLGTGAENQAYALAREVPGIDILLTGHTHQSIPPQKLGGVWIAQPGRFGNTLTRFDVDYWERAGGFRVDIAGENLSMASVAPERSVERLVEPEDRAAMARLEERVARLARPVSARLARVADTGLLDWLHGVEQRAGKAELSFASLLPGRLPDWPAGALTVRQIWQFYPYDNTLVTLRASGRQIREALEVAGRCISGIAIEQGHPVWHRNPAVWGYNCDTMGGAEYALDPTRPAGHRLIYLRRGGKEVADEAMFAVAVNSYRAAGGGGYGVFRRCPRISETTEGLRDLLIADARRRRRLELSADGNWLLAPTWPEGAFRPEERGKTNAPAARQR
jgi:2',3'-cyclic-nucleotide 2'-phosphodiesterase (5'-nucleotidase family)